MNQSAPKVSLISFATITGCFAASLTFMICLDTFARDMPGSETIPNLPESQQLATKSLRDINQAVLTGDFLTFHSTLSPVWQDQVTVEELAQIMNPLRTSNVDFSEAAKLIPFFHENPIIDQQGVLILSGEFPANPLRATFTFRYSRHESGWKLLGLDVTRKAHRMPIPKSNGLTELSRSTLKGFAEAVASRDFSNFHSSLATLFQNTQTPDSLRDAFGVFVARNINLRPDRNFDPIFEREPVISPEGIMTVLGHYDTALSKVDFALDYIPEDSEWKLIEIKIAANPR